MQEFDFLFVHNRRSVLCEIRVVLYLLARVWRRDWALRARGWGSLTSVAGYGSG